MNIDYRINDLQARILSLLKERQPLTITQLQALTGESKTLVSIEQRELRERLFAVAEKTGQHKTIQVTITAHGEIALNAYRKKCEILAKKPVESTRINLMAQPVWVPPAHGYCRNGGHGHIPSLGMNLSQLQHE